MTLRESRSSHSTLKAIITYIMAALAVTISHAGVLDAYIQSAVQTNAALSTLRTYQRVGELEGQRLAAQVSAPQVSLIANAMVAPIVSYDGKIPVLIVNPLGSNRYIGYDGAASNGGQFLGMVNVSKQFFTSAVSEANRATIQSQRGQLQVAIDRGVHDLEKAVVDRYLVCLQDKVQWMYADSAITLISDQIRVMESLAAAGIVRESDVALVNLERKSFVVQRAAFASALRRDVADFKVLCGLLETDSVIVDAVDIRSNQAIGSSQYLASFTADSLAAVTTFETFKTRYVPQVSGFANAGVNAVNVATLTSRFGMSLGVNVTMNLYDGAQAGLEEIKVHEQLLTISANARLLQTRLAEQIMRTTQEIVDCEQRLDLLNATVEESVRAVAVIRKELASGQAIAPEYARMLRVLSTYKKDAAVLRVDLLGLKNTLNYLNW